MAQINFDARNVEPDQGRGDPIPAAWYNMAMVESEIKPTGGGTGHALATQFAVLDGLHKGRRVFFNMNIKNANAQTVEIAYKQLSAICHAAQRLTVGDTTELHNIPVKCRVKIRMGDLKDPQNPQGERYDPSNEITSFKNINDQSVGNAAQAAPAAAPAFAPPPAGQQAWQPPAQAAPQQQQAPVQQQQWQPPASAQPWQPPADPAAAQPQQQFAPPAQQAPAAAPPWGPPA